MGSTEVSYSPPHTSSETTGFSTPWSDIITSAWQRRANFAEKYKTDCWRILHGYSEGAPGTVIEKFADHAIIEFKDDIRKDLDVITNTLREHYPFAAVIAKGHQSLGLKLKQRVYNTYGSASHSPLVVQEQAVRYSVLPGATHNCGLYLDARPVRKWLRANSHQRRILNLFAFTGSLGMAALKGDAADVIHLDKSAELVSRIEATYSANDAKFDNRSFIRGDIYKHLPKAIKRGQRFDGIILDPPPKVYASPFAKNKPKGQDFAQLVRMCSRLLTDDGWLLAMFHRFDSSWEEEEERVIKASEATLRPCVQLTSDEDFPEFDVNKKLRVSVFKKC